MSTGIVMPLSSWGDIVRSSSTVVYDPYQGLPPIKIYRNRIDLEFPPLLQADRIVMDRQSYDLIVRAPLRGLDCLARSLRTLREHRGMLEVQSYMPALDQALRWKIVNTTNQALCNVEAYRDPVRRTIAIWDRLAPSFAKALGQDRQSDFVQPIGILHGARADGDRITLARIREVRRVVAKKRDLTPEETALLKEVLRPYLDHVHTNLALAMREALGCPVHDWSDLTPIYQAVYAHTLADECVSERRARKLNELFVALPQFEPTNILQFLRIMTHSRVKDLRRFIADATATETAFDPQILKASMDKVASSGARSRSVQHALTAASTLGGASLHHAFSNDWLMSLAAGIAIGAVTELSLNLTRRLSHDDIGWFLCLSSVKEA